jgi:hypothetical protein
MKIFKTAVNDAKTHDIIYALCMAAPAAIKQAKQFNLPEIIGLQGANLQNDAILTGKWIRANIKYKVDSFENQNIQLPSALLKSKTGDCKSISLLYLAIMEAAGYNGGFRFAAYRGNNFTHVYNFFVNKNLINTFDACIKDLKEHKKYTNIKDMKVNYIAGTPLLINQQTNNTMQKLPIKLLMRDDRYASINGIGRKKRKPLFPKLNKIIKKGGQAVKTVAMAPARGSFLVLVNLNYKGLATKLNEALAKNAAKVTEMWTKFGGDTAALQKSINNGKGKKPRGGMNGIGEEAAGGEGGVNTKDIIEGVGAASGIISVVIKLFQSLGIGKGKKDPLKDDVDPNASIDPNIEPGEDFFANDPASDEAKNYALSAGQTKPKTLQASSMPGTGGNTSNFKISPLLIGGGLAAIAAIYLITKKK